MLTNFVRRILGPSSFPRFKRSQEQPAADWGKPDPKPVRKERPPKPDKPPKGKP